MSILEYQKPATIDETLSLLDRYGKKAALVAGGTDIMVLVKKKAISPEVLISLQGISGLNRIDHDGLLRIGPTVTHRTIEKSPLIRRDFTALTDAVDVLGSVQIRNVGTIGGNICTAVPSSDTAPPLLVLGTEVKIKSARGERVVPLEAFFKGPGCTVLEEGEIVTELTIPSPLPNTASAYWKHQRRQALDLPIVGVAVLLTLNKHCLSDPAILDSSHPVAAIFQSLEPEKLVCEEVRIALGVAAPTPMRAFMAENLLRGRSLSRELLDEVAQIASEEAQPRDSLRGEAWYRREMIKVFVKRMVLTCIERIISR